LEEVSDYFGSKDCLKNCAVAARADKGHGRIEKRTCYATSDIGWISRKADWKCLKSIVMIIAERTVKGKLTVEKRFFISSAKPDPLKLLCATRAHWGIENSLHWVLDVIFGEDDRIIWNQNIAQNESIIRRIALNLLKKYRLLMPTKSARSEKIALKTLRKVLPHDDEGMFKLLQACF
jgi:predicted transposase YbfD/YdcC